jgi:transcriptional regulator with XRE-family HTH domain
MSVTLVETQALQTLNKWREQIITSRTFADFILKLPHSDTELAQLINADPSTIYRWKHGQNIPDIGTIVELELALDMEPHDAKILIRKSRQAFGDERHDYELLKKLHREPIDKTEIDAEYECYANIIDRDFPTALRRILVWRKLSKKQLAILCGVGANRISEWLSGIRQPDADKICSSLRLPQPIANLLKNF